MSTTKFSLLSLLLIISLKYSYSQKNNTVSAVFVFGDSTVDPGNNNYLVTISKGNFPPYGRDFANHEPTGRFSNGRLVPDIYADFLGVKKNVPPYLDPSLTIEDLMTGVSFASAGAGFDPLTSKLGVILLKLYLSLTANRGSGTKPWARIIKLHSRLVDKGIDIGGRLTKRPIGGTMVFGIGIGVERFGLVLNNANLRISW
ncbi:SGNH hydrolase-type esterase domain-containing protein [Artemisia annua]|uniref:SGNH hydrolase-type esterase domain-containing protein n=1 Tax=Artemisia annua TaxID=35608 RepID=A0A2U1P0F8_ARTAN|nr:SGNH hydrolase-type esterase domain-containing protein [Artemisia annua]